MVSQGDYPVDKVVAAKSVLIELIHVLGEYRESIVLVGGWVPELMPLDRVDGHIGSIDVDLALDHRHLQDQGYERIRSLLIGRGYEQGSRPFIFHRRVKIGSQEITVEVDLLAGEYGGTSKSHTHQKIHKEKLAHKARGCDLAFDISPIEVQLEGALPDGGLDHVTVRVAAVVPFLVMKCAALGGRLKEKDAYDIYFIIRNYPGRLEALAKEFMPHRGHGLVREALDSLAKAFSSPSALGPRFIADFYGIEDRDERDRLQRDAYERVNSLLKKLA